MQRGKLATEQANIAKTEREENARLWKAIQEAKANGEYFESDNEIRTLPLEKLVQHLKQINRPDNSPYDWTPLEQARWKRLAWRAKQLGFDNPFALIQN